MPSPRLLLGTARRLLDRRPWAAHLYVTEQCNLDCHYCNEYDNSIPHPPLAAQPLVFQPRARHLRLGLNDLLVELDVSHPPDHASARDPLARLRRQFDERGALGRADHHLAVRQRDEHAVASHRCGPRRA